MIHKLLRIIFSSLLLWILISIVSISSRAFLFSPIIVIAIVVLLSRWKDIGWREGILIVLFFFLLDALLLLILQTNLELARRAFLWHFIFPIRAFLAFRNGVNAIGINEVVSITVTYYSPFLLPLGIFLLKKYRRK